MQPELRYEVDISGAVKRLDAVGVAINPDALLGVIGNRQLTWILQNFEQQGGKDGSKQWAPLRPNTIAARGGSGMILQNKRTLLRAFGYHADRDGVDVGVINEAKEGQLSVRDVARFHEFGTDPYTIRPKTKKRLYFMTTAGMVFRREVHHPGLPARPMLPPKPIAERVAVNVVEARIEQATK